MALGQSRRPARGCTNMPLTLVVWSARPIQPLMRMLVRPQGETPGSIAERSPVREPDHRIIRVERGDDHLADLALRRPDRRCRAARSRRSAFSLTIMPSQRLALVGDHAELGGGIALQHGDAAPPSSSRSDAGSAAPDTSAALERGRVLAGLLARYRAGSSENPACRCSRAACSARSPRAAARYCRRRRE